MGGSAAQWVWRTPEKVPGLCGHRGPCCLQHWGACYSLALGAPKVSSHNGTCGTGLNPVGFKSGQVGAGEEQSVGSELAACRGPS